LAFFAEVDEAWVAGMSVAKVCQKATRAVAEEFGVAYSTVQEACVQRLGHANVDELHQEVGAWLRSSMPQDLIARLKAHAAESLHEEIEEFFNGDPGLSDKELAVAAIRALPETATIEDAIDRLERLAGA
jgi:hypothetical protein